MVLTWCNKQTENINPFIFCTCLLSNKWVQKMNEWIFGWNWKATTIIFCSLYCHLIVLNLILVVFFCFFWERVARYKRSSLSICGKAQGAQTGFEPQTPGLEGKGADHLAKGPSTATHMNSFYLTIKNQWWLHGAYQTTSSWRHNCTLVPECLQRHRLFSSQVIISSGSVMPHWSSWCF